jgi:serine phosphatase RsbU (regulator of sigma subunit)
MPDAQLFDGSPPDPWQQELENFIRIFRRIRPRSCGARIGEIEIYGDSVFLNRIAGGDHIVYLDFERRYDLDNRIREAAAEGRHRIASKLADNRNRIGVLVADVAGHSVTDALVAAMLHQALLTGVLYELDQFGEVTTRLFENLNTRFFNSLSVEKYLTLTYGEITGEGRFRFISAGSPPPLVFSAEFDRLVSIQQDRLVGYCPLGMFPSEDDVDVSRNLGPLGYKPRYTVNEVNLMGAGDLLLLMTDGVADHEDERGGAFVPDHLETTLRTVKHLTPKDVYEAILDSAVALAPPADDMTLVVVKRAGRPGGG